jgi:hypothetical protein
MKKIFTPEYIGQIIIQFLIIGIILFFVQNHFQNKWAPLTAAETLKKENFLNAKRDTYFEAINILNRNLANSQFIINGVVPDSSKRNIGGSYPTDVEINSCFSKLCIYSDNPQIPLTYQKLFYTNDKNIRPILEMVNFINLVRRDLGYGDAIIDTIGDRYKFIQTHRQFKH